MMTVKLRDEERLTRLISLSYILSTRSEIHIDELIERLGTNRKQVENDLNLLMFIGLPPYSPEQLFDISIDDDYVSMYFNDVFTSPLKLDADEKTQLLVALARLEASSSIEEKEPVKKVVSIIDDTIDSVAVENIHGQYDVIILDAIEQHVCVNISYLSLSSASLKLRKIEPYALYTTASISYVFGFDYISEQVRMFRTDRIIDVEVTSEPFSHKPSSSKEVEARKENIFIEDKQEYSDLKIDKNASWLLDSFPHETIDEGEGIYRFFSSSPFFTARLLVSNINHVHYVAGTISKDSIVDAINIIRDRMIKTGNGTY